MSKKVILVTSLNIYTELSKLSMYDPSIRDKITTAELTHLFVSFRTFYQMNEIISQDFYEFAYEYSKLSHKSDESMEELKSQQQESEKTLINIVEYYDRVTNEKANQVTQLILALIGCLTIYSVVNDVFSFLPIDDSNPIRFSRLSTISFVTLVLVGLGIYLKRTIFTARK